MSTQEQSDLNNLVQRVVETALSLQRAEAAHAEAKRQYDNFTHDLTMKYKGESK